MKKKKYQLVYNLNQAITINATNPINRKKTAENKKNSKKKKRSKKKSIHADTPVKASNRMDNNPPPLVIQSFGENVEYDEMDDSRTQIEC